jgi:hypothetical protein
MAGASLCGGDYLEPDNAGRGTPGGAQRWRRDRLGSAAAGCDICLVDDMAGDNGGDESGGHMGAAQLGWQCRQRPRKGARDLHHTHGAKWRTNGSTSDPLRRSLFGASHWGVFCTTKLAGDSANGSHGCRAGAPVSAADAATRAAEVSAEAGGVDGDAKEDIGVADVGGGGVSVVGLPRTGRWRNGAARHYGASDGGGGYMGMGELAEGRRTGIGSNNNAGGVALGWPSAPKAELTWEPWSAARVAELQQEGRYIYVDFTARWCATCQVNKAVVWGDSRVKADVQRRNVALLKADWTNADSAITEELRRYGRAAIPFALVYTPSSAKPQELPELLTADEVMRALSK